MSDNLPPLPEPDMSHEKARDDSDLEYSYSASLVRSYAAAAVAAERERWHVVVQRMVDGIDHLDRLTREWEPDHSSGADRRGWLLAKDARDDAVRLLSDKNPPCT